MWTEKHNPWITLKTALFSFADKIKESLTLKNGLIFGSGFAICGFLSLEYVRRVKGLTRLQLVGVILSTHGNYSIASNPKYLGSNNNFSEIHKVLPYAQTRPSDQALAMWTSGFDVLNYDKH